MDDTLALDSAQGTVRPRLSAPVMGIAVLAIVTILLTWTNHLTLAYGLDYALVCFLLAVLVFQRRSLARD
jgi:hypothetical protein